MSSHVYVVSKGELHEGGIPIAVFYELKDAKKRALSQSTRMRPWIPVTPFGRGGTWEWTSGCDWLAINRLKIQ